MMCRWRSAGSMRRSVKKISIRWPCSSERGPARTAGSHEEELPTMPPAPPEEEMRTFWRLRSGCTIHHEEGGQDDGAARLTVRYADNAYPIGACAAASALALDRLREGCDEPRLAEAAAQEGADAIAIAHCLHLLVVLRRYGFVNEVIAGAAGEYAAREPMSSHLSFASSPLPQARQARLRLSRFALLSRHEGEAVLESPLSSWRIRIHDPAAAILICRLMGEGMTVAAIEEAGKRARTLAGWLLACNLAGEIDAEGHLPEDTDPDLRFWEFHDLLHARRSRSGGHDHPLGATFPGRGIVEPLPAVKPAMVSRAQDIVPLPRADLESACRDDPPFQAVVEARHSIRAHGRDPIRLEQVGAFLYRSARLIERVPPAPEHELFYEASRRPWPCGGAAYETEIYLTINNCEGLDRGIYHYDPEHHRLERLSRDEGMVDALIETAWHSAAQTVRPQLLLTLTARMRRLSWKYRGMAWAVALKHAGVLYHAFYLTATTMGLAPCGLGGGNTELVARAIGIAPAVEMPIGEFMLGSLPEQP
ncbi:MAG: SagB/ThcOx family dehydrogenase [Alphaproteobacteria bacterium]|nr:MAG: SagB/ThcOx family dehydrogenase [Alphaproteobacteria bacterium]